MRWLGMFRHLWRTRLVLDVAVPSPMSEDTFPRTRRAHRHGKSLLAAGAIPSTCHHILHQGILQTRKVQSIVPRLEKSHDSKLIAHCVQVNTGLPIGQHEHVNQCQISFARCRVLGAIYAPLTFRLVS